MANFLSHDQRLKMEEKKRERGLEEGKERRLSKREN
jgi:hypothetical protein